MTLSAGPGCQEASGARGGGGRVRRKDLAGEIRPKCLPRETNLYLCCQPGITKPKTFVPNLMAKVEGPADFSQAQCQLPASGMEPIPFRGLGSPGTQHCAWSAGYPKKGFRDAPLTVHGRDGTGPQPTDRGSINVCLVGTRGKKSSRQDLRS